ASRPGYECFRDNMSQIRNDTAAALPSARAYVARINRASMLTRKFCELDPAQCRRSGLHVSSVMLPESELAKLSYKPAGARAGSGGGGSSAASSGPGEGSSATARTGRGSGGADIGGSPVKGTAKRRVEGSREGVKDGLAGAKP